MIQCWMIKKNSSYILPLRKKIDYDYNTEHTNLPE